MYWFRTHKNSSDTSKSQITKIKKNISRRKLMVSFKKTLSRIILNLFVLLVLFAAKSALLTSETETNQLSYHIF